MSPAKPKDLYIDEDKLYALVVFEDEDINKAIGREGINIRLTSSITGFKIDAIKASDYDKSKSIEISTLEDLSDKFKKIFNDNNILTTTDYFNTESDVLLSIKGIGEKTLEKIDESIKKEVSRS